MFALFFLCTSLILSILGIVILRHNATRLGLIDQPGNRKVHSSPTPLVGGGAIYISLVYCWTILQFLPKGSTLATVPMFVAMAMVVIEGIWDDQKGRPARHRFIFHVVVALIMVNWANIGLYDLGQMFDGDITYTGAWMVPLTVFSASGGINAYNMIDGIDGLAGSIALVSVMGMLGLAYYGGRMPEVYLLATMAGAIVGFLLFNIRAPWRKEASVFLGDSGSMLIGLMMVWSMTHLSQGDGRVMQPVMALWFFTVPLFDAVSLIIRRTMNHRSPLEADQRHIHHMFLKMGFTVSQTVVILTGTTFVLMSTAIVANAKGVPQYYMFYSFLVLFAMYLYGTHRFWHRFEAADVAAKNRETV